MARLKKSLVDTEIRKAEKEKRLWDDDPRGLGLRIKLGGAATFFVQYVSPVTFKKVRHSIGQYGRLTIDQARTQAKRLFEDVARGKDPAIEKRQAKHHARTAVTVSEFCDDYQKDAESGLVLYRGRAKRPSTLAGDRGRIIRHIKPTLGEKFIRDVTRRDVEQAMNAIRLGKTSTNVKTGLRGRAVVTGGAGTASRAIALLGSIFSYAIKQGIRSDNPVSGIERPADGKRDRVLSPDEYKRLGKALDAFERQGANKTALRAFRAIALTGCRRGEIYGLKKSEVDSHNQCLRLGDTKSGQQVRAIGRAAMDVLTLPSINGKSEYVFPAAHGDGHLTDAKLFRKICKEAKLESVSLHVFRHGFASVALELEYSELTIAGLLGHQVHSVTGRYAHHVDRALIAAADRVSALIAARMEGREAEGAEVVHLQHKKG